MTAYLLIVTYLCHAGYAKTHILGGKTNLMESCFGGYIIHAWGYLGHFWGLSPNPIVLALVGRLHSPSFTSEFHDALFIPVNVCVVAKLL